MIIGVVWGVMIQGVAYIAYETISSTVHKIGAIINFFS